MNIFREHKPYVFRPAKYSPVLAPLLQMAGEALYLRRRFRVRKITVEGAERVAALARSGRAVLIAPNHADHADPHVLLYAARRSGMRCHFMAAREGFERSWLNRFVLQRCGAFSVDREGADIAAFKAAVRILREGRFPLVVFPEGEIYHHHEQLDPLNEGVATMILRAGGGKGNAAYLAPTAIRYFYDESVAEGFDGRLAALERRITWKPRSDSDVVERVFRLGSGLLAIKEIEYFGSACDGELTDRITGLRDRLVELVERRHGDCVGTGSTPERVKALRGRIRQRLTSDDGSAAPEDEAGLHDDIETLFVAVQLYSYPGQYLREDPSVHRIAETILKLEEDVLGEATYAAPRDVRVCFGEPIDVGAFLEERSLTAKSGAGPLTAELSERIQSLVEGLG